jgi:hypothetical protein
MDEKKACKSLTQLVFLLIALLFSSCEEGPVVMEQQDLNLTSNPKKLPPDSFLTAPGKSIFY